MPEPIQTNLPPKTEILSETRREITDPSQTSPNQGLADPSQVAAEVTPDKPLEQETETVDQPFTIDEGEEPPPGEELPSGEEPPTGDRVKDAQEKMHQTTEELAKMKKVLAAVVANAQMGGGQAPQQAPQIPPEMLSSEPTEEEKLDPTKYTRRMFVISEMKNRHDAAMQEMEGFVDSHPDWQNLYPTMQEISNEEPPGTFQRPGGLRRLHKRAIQLEKLRKFESNQNQLTDVALQAGAQTQRAKGGKPFVSPSGGVTARSGKQKTMPADFSRWDVGKQVNWLRDHGLYKDE